jgi:adenosine deaminase
MAAVPLSVLRELPKVDLHSHIDGSIPLGDLFRIAKRHGRRVVTSKGVEIDSVSSFVSHVIGAGYDSLLDDIVDRFSPITNVMQTQEVLREVGIAFAEGMQRDNVFYAEGRFAPQYHTKEGLSMEEVITSMAEGLAEGCERYRVRICLFVAIGRESAPTFGEAVVKAALRTGSAVALDLGGPEAGNPPEKFANAFKLAAGGGLKLTVHAGEGAGSQQQNHKNIRSAISVLGAQRVGHAVDLARDQSLIGLVRENSVGVETNPVSNLALGKIKRAEDLQIDKLLASSVSVGLNSDDPAFWPRGKLSEVFALVCRSYRFGLDTVDRLIANAIDGAFLGDTEKQSLHEEYRSARKKLA